MPSRLDTQRATVRPHIRKHSRLEIRYSTLPHEVWGDSYTGGAAVPATSATAGIPGGWVPAGSTPPTTVANLIAGTPNPVTASPATAWTTGQYVQTQTAGVGGRAYWNSTAWVAGAAP